jgi:hypothetical protein
MQCLFFQKGPISLQNNAQYFNIIIPVLYKNRYTSIITLFIISLRLKHVHHNLLKWTLSVLDVRIFCVKINAFYISSNKVSFFIDQSCDKEKKLKYSFLEIENSLPRNLIPVNLMERYIIPRTILQNLLNFKRSRLYHILITVCKK